MKEFLQLLRRFVPPYKKYLVWALFLNLLSAFLTIFSFTLIIPILQILFKMVVLLLIWQAFSSHQNLFFFNIISNSLLLFLAFYKLKK